MLRSVESLAWTLLAQEPKEPADAEKPVGLMESLPGLMLPIGMIVILYIVLMVLPQRREQKKVQDFLGNLKKNDEVILQGGIMATIINIQKDSEFVTVRIDETTNAKMKVLRSAILKVVADKDEATTEKS